MPNISASVYRALLLHVVGTLYLIQERFGCRYLVRTHHKQQVLLCKHTEACKNIEQGVAREECGSKVNQVVEYLIAGICPITGKLKRVACLWLIPVAAFFDLIDMAVTRSVAVILGLCAVAHHKDLHILKQSVACPEALSTVAVYLVESLLDAHTSPLQLNVYQWQTIHKNADIVSVGALAVPHLILVDHLCAVGMNIILLNQIDVFLLTVVTLQGLYEVGLYSPRLVYNSFPFGCYLCFEETAPFIIGEVVIVQFLQFYAQICNEVFLIVYLCIFITLPLELFNERTLQVGFGLIAFFLNRYGTLIMSHHGTGIVF